MNSEDKALIKKIYELSDEEVFEADKLYRRSGFSVCAAAKVIINRRKAG